MTRIKEDIIRELMNRINLERDNSKYLIDLLLDIIKNHFKAGDKLMISGIGTFNVRHKKERVGRNPQTKEIHMISARNVVNFVPSRKFREDIAK